MIFSISETTIHFKITKLTRETQIYNKSVIIRMNSQQCLRHLIDCFFCLCCQFFMTCTSAELFKLFSIFYKHTCNKYRFRYSSLRRSGRLERFSRFTGKTVQIQTIIPVCPSDQRKFMRSTMTLIMYLNKHLFSKNYGMGGALSVFLFIITGVLSLIVFRFNKTNDGR